MQVKYFGLALAAFSFTVCATNVTVYRWVDENNVVHFSQQQPSHDNYTELTMSAAHQKKLVDQTNQVEEEPTALDIEGSNDQCEEAKANVQTLKTYDKIQYQDSNGDVKLLTAVQKQQQLAISEKQVEVYCSDN
ncbi:DUF4124 domain-containing protein [Thalassotalea ganghwensis]